MAQVPINVGDAKYDPLFPFGFGLAWTDQGTTVPREKGKAAPPGRP
jgi:hypothetical protein